MVGLSEPAKRLMAGLISLGLKSLGRRIPVGIGNRCIVFLAGQGRRSSKQVGIRGAKQSYSSSTPALGFEEFFEVKKPNEVISAGRSWTSADLRRKVRKTIHSFTLQTQNVCIFIQLLLLLFYLPLFLEL